MSQSDNPISLRCKVIFTRARHGRKMAGSVHSPNNPAKPVVGPRRVVDPSCVPKVTRSLVLAHHLERLVRDGNASDYTELARLVGLSKARISQLTVLTLLAPDIQDRILRLTLADSRGLSERILRRVAALTDWNNQRAAFKIAQH